jgi:hypothetical protein
VVPNQRLGHLYLIYSAVIMNVQKCFLPVGVGLSLSLALVPLGCSKGGSSSSVDPKGESTHIAKAANHLNKYIADNKGKIPKDTGEMKAWAANNNIAEDELLSSRDHEPYEVHNVAKGPTHDLVITEKTGVKGKKFMWRSQGPTGLGMEEEQGQIDGALKGGTYRGDMKNH